MLKVITVLLLIIALTFTITTFSEPHTCEEKFKLLQIASIFLLTALLARNNCKD